MPLEKSQPRWNQVIITLLVASITMIAGCKKDEVDTNNNDEYYVKYEVNSSTIYSGGKLEVSLNSETNTTKTFTVNQRALGSNNWSC